MIKQIYIETLKKLWRSNKTHIFSLLVLLSIGIYGAVILPNTQPIDTVDMERLEIDRLANESIMEDRARSGRTEANNFTGISTYQQAKHQLSEQRSFQTIIQTGDARRLIQSPYLSEKLNQEITEYYLANSEAPLKDLRYDRMNQMMRQQSYLEDVDNITFHLIQEKTAWQQVQLFFLDWGPIILAIATVFLVSDVVTRERQERTQKLGIPYGWKKYLFVQSLASFSFVIIFLFASLLLFWAFTGLMFGFGSLDLKVPQYIYTTDYATNGSEYNLMTIGSFMKQVVPFLLLFTYLMIRLGTVFSLWFKNDVVVMVAGIFVVIFEKLYFDRRMRGIFGLPLGYYPQTYFDYGKVVSGEKNFLLNTDSISIQRGLLVVVGTIVVVEIVLWISATVQSRQKYVG